MADPAQFDIIAWRNVDNSESWSFLDEDWTGSTFKMQVRIVRGSTGSPLLEHTTGTGAFALGVTTATVASHVAANRLETEIYELINPATGIEYQASDTVLLSQLILGQSATNLATLPFPQPPGERGDDWTGYYDILRIPPTGSTDLVLEGRFIVPPGVTLP